MHVIDASEFSVHSEPRLAELGIEVKAGLMSPHRSVLIRNFGNTESNYDLIRLATSLGRPHAEPEFADHPLEDQFVFRVESRERGIKDSRGVVLYSTTHFAFSSHTDGCGKRDPYDVVLLYCVRNSDGGESILITVEDLLKCLNPLSIEVLRTQIFPVPFGLAPVLSGPSHDALIRYNPSELLLYARMRRIQFDEAQKNALADLAQSLSQLEARQPRLKLLPGDCLLVDNKRALHGRTAFEPCSNRLLKRVRLYWV